MAYKCPECGAIFEQPEFETVCLEELYGVSSMFYDSHYRTFANCPECGEAIDIEYDIYEYDIYEYDIYDEEYDDEGEE